MQKDNQQAKAYFLLTVSTILSFFSMYIIMYSMVARIEHVLPNINKVYMALLMTAPMVIFMLLLMREMYVNRLVNIIILISSIALFLLSFLAIRNQYGVGDVQFLRAMIPHHSGAILMCERSDIQDKRVLDLCERIIASQKEEIAEMEGLLSDLE